VSPANPTITSAVRAEASLAAYRDATLFKKPRSAPRVRLREPAGHRRERFIEPGLPPSKAVIDYRPGRGHRVFFEIQHTLKLIRRWPPP
jgi:hypothetical protein